MKISISLAAPPAALSVLLAVIPASVLAQDEPVSEATLPGRTLLPSVLEAAATAQGVGLQRLDGNLTGGGANYRVDFSDDSVVFMPSVGEDAPADSRLRLRLDSIRRGTGASPWFAARAEPRVAGLNRVHYAREQGVTERYDVRSEGVELSYVFQQRPAGQGDLVVRLAVDTGGLSARPGLGHRTLDFTFGDGLGVHVGAVTGVDARGDTTPGSMNWDGRNLELVLPAAFVDDARYPLVLDPLVGSLGQISFGTPDDGAPDVAYDATTNRYLFVWERAVTAADFDVIGQLVDGSSGALIGGQFTIAGGSGNQRHPAVASINLRDRFLVAWDNDQVGNLDVECRAVVAATGSLENVLLVAGTAADESFPDVGGESTLVDDDALVVWQHASEGIKGSSIQILSAGGIGVVIANANAQISFLGPNNARPAICKSGGPSGRFVVAWEATGNFIAARAVDRNLNAISVAGLVNATGGTSVLRPDVAGDGESFLLAYQQFESGGSGRSDVWAIDVIIPTSPSGSLGFFRKAALVEVPGVDEYSPSLCMAGSHFAVTWTEEQPNTRREARTTNVTTGVWATCGAVVQSGFNPTIRTKMAAKRDGDANLASDEAMIAYERRSGVPAGDIAAQGYETFGGGPISTVSPGCGTAGTASTSGPFAIGNQNFEVTLSGADPLSTFAAMNIGIPSSGRTTCNACVIMDPLFAVTTTVTNGATSTGLPIPCDPNLTGVTLDVQYVVVTSGGRACTVSNRLAWTNTLRMVLAD